MYSNKLITLFFYCLYCAMQLSLMKLYITTVKIELCYVLLEFILPKAITINLCGMTTMAS